MARRASRDPDELLRAHFSAELEAARREASPPPRPKTGLRFRESETGAAHRRRRSGEPAAAAALIFAFGLGLWRSPPVGGLSRALAENAPRSGQAREVGALIGGGVSSAIDAFKQSLSAGSATSGAPDIARFR